MLTGGKLEQLLRLPIARLPQYMMYFSHIYLTLPNQESEAALQLGQSVIAIQATADEIAKAQADARNRYPAVAFFGVKTQPLWNPGPKER